MKEAIWIVTISFVDKNVKSASYDMNANGANWSQWIEYATLNLINPNEITPINSTKTLNSTHVNKSNWINTTEFNQDIIFQTK